MKVENRTIVITDPCYMKHSSTSMKRNTIYGDWSCMVYPGNMKENTKPNEWNEVYFKFFANYNSLEKNEKRDEIAAEFNNFKENWKSNILGEFCADSGRVGVYIYDDLSEEDKLWISEHPWCACIIKDFTGDVEFEVVNEELHVVGYSEETPFFSVQSGF